MIIFAREIEDGNLPPPGSGGGVRKKKKIHE